MNLDISSFNSFDKCIHIGTLQSLILFDDNHGVKKGLAKTGIEVLVIFLGFVVLIITVIRVLISRYV